MQVVESLEEELARGVEAAEASRKRRRHDAKSEDGGSEEGAWEDKEGKESLLADSEEGLMGDEDEEDEDEEVEGGAKALPGSKAQRTAVLEWAMEPG